MMRELVFVTGYFGAPIRETAEKIAATRGSQLLDLDAEIVRRDGRSIARICMMGGEHAYRNAEYEIVTELVTGSFMDARSGKEDAGLVILCGDGILYDDQSRDRMRDYELVIAGEDLTEEALWAGASRDPDTWHAFMRFGSASEQRSAFHAYYLRQKDLFGQIL